MKFFLDTDTCIYYLKGMYENIKPQLLENNPDNIKIPAIVKAELLYGAEKSKKKEDNLLKIREFLLPFEIIGFTDRETAVYSKIRASLESDGMPIGPNDLLIASTVKSHDGILVTNNEDEFLRIPDLQVENWIR